MTSGAGGLLLRISRCFGWLSAGEPATLDDDPVASGLLRPIEGLIGGLQQDHPFDADPGRCSTLLLLRQTFDLEASRNVGRPGHSPWSSGYVPFSAIR